MLFNVHMDTLDRIEGYFVPNGFSAKPRIKVTGRGKMLFVGYCNELIEDLRRVGRHPTGLVGFAIDASHIVGIAGIEDLCIFDADTGFLIYRRNSLDHFVQKKAISVETTRGAAQTLGASLAPHFAYGLTGAHFYDHETMNQLFNLANYPSMFFEGRIYIKQHQRYLNESLFSIISIDEPFIALASTLIALMYAEQTSVTHFDERTYAIMQPFIEHVADIDLGNSRKVRKCLSSIPKAAMQSIESPLAGQLTSQTPGVTATHRDIPAALETLSAFDLVITDIHSAQARKECERALGLPSGCLRNTLPQPEVIELAETLRSIQGLEAALENDLIIYHCLEKADYETT